ncbi:recombinase family protein [Streptococcus oralis]|uniref:recombinase family protein n=1 Tax=Streptococcus oralis TaxID=1303 RepID=UPI00240D417C|nr:recombinase family protein [Streptococcus oralis]
MVVECMYSLIAIGFTRGQIKRLLEENKIPSLAGCHKWTSRVIRNILTNEKYIGDALLQKSFTVDYLTKKKKKNEGELPQYYVENNHESIISREVYEVAREVVSRSTNVPERVYSLGGKIICKEVK